MSAVAVDGLCKAFGKIIALDHVGFAVSHGEFLCIVGRSNAGKSTVLKTIAGLYRPDRGRICVGGRLPARRLAKVLQQYNGSQCSMYAGTLCLWAGLHLVVVMGRLKNFPPTK